MDNLINVFANDDKDDNQVNEKKPPPRVCPRCSSNNTKFCYFNNYSVSQPRYFCKNCRRYWTHGGALRNIPIGGSGRKSKRAKVGRQSLVSHMVSVENQPVINHQPSGSFGGHSSTVLGNTFGSLSDISYGVTNVSPVPSFRPIDRLDFPDDLFQQGYFDHGLNDLIGDPLINQPLGGYVDDHNGYRINHVDQPEWNQSFMSNNTMNMNHIASARKMNMNNKNIRNSCFFRSTCQLE